jgi:hypothetical protein
LDLALKPLHELRDPQLAKKDEGTSPEIGAASYQGSASPGRWTAPQSRGNNRREGLWATTYRHKSEQGDTAMCDDDIHQGLTYDSKVSRRTFGVMTVAAAGVASSALAADVNEKDVEVKTADGTCDAALYAPSKKGKYPAVLI